MLENHRFKLRLLSFEYLTIVLKTKCIKLSYGYAKTLQRRNNIVFAINQYIVKSNAL